MRYSMPFRVIAWTVVLFLTLGSINVFAEKPGSHKAFLRGGNAISEALHQSKTPEPLLAARFIPAQPPAMSAMPQEKGKHSRVALWIGLAVTGTIAAYLVRRSVKNHQSIFGPKG